MSATGSLENRYRYTNREYVESGSNGTELYYYRARYYRPDLGRFISKDPLGMIDGTNMFIYVQNDPVKSGDPLGLTIWICNRKKGKDRNSRWNHPYFWDSISGECCGYISPKDSCIENGPKTSINPGGDDCRPVSGSEGHEQGILDCCNRTQRSTKEQYFPGFYDCHTHLKNCVEDIFNLDYSGSPGDRSDSPCDDPNCDPTVD